MENVVYLKDIYRPSPNEASVYEEIQNTQYEIVAVKTEYSEDFAEVQTLEEFKRQFLVVCLVGLNIGFLIGFLMVQDMEESKIITVCITMIDGSRWLDCEVFLPTGDRLSDVMNDDRNFLPVRRAGKEEIIAKSQISFINETQEH